MKVVAGNSGASSNDDGSNSKAVAEDSAMAKGSSSGQGAAALRVRTSRKGFQQWSPSKEAEEEEGFSGWFAGLEGDIPPPKPLKPLKGLGLSRGSALPPIRAGAGEGTLDDRQMQLQSLQQMESDLARKKEEAEAPS